MGQASVTVVWYLYLVGWISSLGLAFSRVSARASLSQPGLVSPCLVTQVGHCHRCLSLNGLCLGLPVSVSSRWEFQVKCQRGFQVKCSSQPGPCLGSLESAPSVSWVQAWAEWRIALSIQWRIALSKLSECAFWSSNWQNRILQWKWKLRKLKKKTWSDWRNCPEVALNLHLFLMFAMAGTFPARSNLDQFSRTLRSTEFVKHVQSSRPCLLCVWCSLFPQAPLLFSSMKP